MSAGSPAAMPAAPFRGSAPFLAKAPELSLPMRHFVAAAAAYWIFTAAFAWGHSRLLGFDFQARWALGLVHTLTLGWVTMTLFGALSQLTPVLWEVSLESPGLLKLAWWLFTGGLCGFVGLLWAGRPDYWVPAVLVGIGATLYLYCFLRTMLAAKKLDWAGKHLALAVGYLAVLAALGVLLAYDGHRGRLFSDPDGVLIAHVHLALIGWVSLSIVGVSYRLVSMFALAHMDTKTPGRLALFLLNAGLIGLAADSLFFHRSALPLWASMLALAYLAYAIQMRRIFNARSRKIDPALGFTLLALLGGAVWTALGLALAFGRLPDTTESRAAYVFCALLGWMTPFILGQIHKIVPFLVWLHVYSKGWKSPAKLPTISDLTSARLAWLELSTLAPGVYAGIAGFLLESPRLLRLSSWLLLLSATLYAANTALSLSHLRRKDVRWT